jgi:hypothetical protein
MPVLRPVGVVSPWGGNFLLVGVGEVGSASMALEGEEYNLGLASRLMASPKSMAERDGARGLLLRPVALAIPDRAPVEDLEGDMPAAACRRDEEADPGDGHDCWTAGGISSHCFLATVLMVRKNGHSSVSSSSEVVASATIRNGDQLDRSGQKMWKDLTYLLILAFWTISLSHQLPPPWGWPSFVLVAESAGCSVQGMERRTS